MLTSSKYKIVFDYSYSMEDYFFIKTKLNTIAQELDRLNIVSPYTFCIGEEIKVVYRRTNSDHSEHFKFECQFETHDDFVLAGRLFILAYEEEFRNEIIKEKELFDEKLNLFLNPSISRADGIPALIEAGRWGIEVNLEYYLSLPDLTMSEIRDFVNNGYAFDYYFSDKNDDINNCNAEDFMDTMEFVYIKDTICQTLLGHSRNHCSENKIIEALKEWIKDNPEKCIFPENRKSKS